MRPLGSQEVEKLKWGQTLKPEKHTFFSKASAPEGSITSQGAPPTGDQVFTALSLWGISHSDDSSFVSDLC